MTERKVTAILENLETVQEFVTGELEKAGFNQKQIMQVDLAVEEIFCNIVNYAYHPEHGDALIRCEIKKENQDRVVIEFVDEGIPYNPLERQDPDVTLALEDREIGGLGIFLTRKLMDSMEYRHENGKNILIISKIKEEDHEGSVCGI
ncbi:MAG: ATP-binding protein [Eubacteriales bacterium]|nr:ATP-binding protein [Eubacteriales bacterium]